MLAEVPPAAQSPPSRPSHLAVSRPQSGLYRFFQSRDLCIQIFERAQQQRPIARVLAIFQVAGYPGARELEHLAFPQHIYLFG